MWLLVAAELLFRRGRVVAELLLLIMLVLSFAAAVGVTLAVAIASFKIILIS